MSNQLNVTFSSGLKDYMEERITAIIGAGAPLTFSVTTNGLEMTSLWPLTN